MIIVLKPNTSDKDIARVEHQIKRNGLDTHIVRGQEMTIIGCIGDTTRLDARLFEVDASVDKVMHVQEPYSFPTAPFIRRILLLMYPVSKSAETIWH